ncbi:Uncharacterised protein [Mannheimia haemolytica]|uniref:Uncharacterized protein n=1 Tax=Mannheimia haemolytica TaxID=75985 RepID=A0A378MYM4_MANHA|nr:Uncharacterised protein [Mannheimia haemolytica]
MMTGGQISLLGEEETEVVSEVIDIEEEFSAIVLNADEAIILKANDEEEESHLALLKLIEKNPKEIAYGQKH